MVKEFTDEKTESRVKLPNTSLFARAANTAKSHDHLAPARRPEFAAKQARGARQQQNFEHQLHAKIYTVKHIYRSATTAHGHITSFVALPPALDHE